MNGIPINRLRSSPEEDIEDQRAEFVRQQMQQDQDNLRAERVAREQGQARLASLPIGYQADSKGNPFVNTNTMPEAALGVTGGVGNQDQIMAQYGVGPQDAAATQAKINEFYGLARGANATQAYQPISPQMQAAFQASALGQGPSVAEQQLAQAQSQSLRDQMALAGMSQGGPMAQYAARQQAMQNQTNLSSNFAAQAAALRAQEMMGARGQYLQGAGLMGEMEGRQRLVNADREKYFYGKEHDYLNRFQDNSMRLAEQAAALRSAHLDRQLRANSETARNKQSFWNSLLGGGLAGGAAAIPIVAAAMGGKDKKKDEGSDEQSGNYATSTYGDYRDY